MENWTIAFHMLALTLPSLTCLCHLSGTGMYYPDVLSLPTTPLVESEAPLFLSSCLHQAPAQAESTDWQIDQQEHWGQEVHLGTYKGDWTKAFYTICLTRVQTKMAQSNVSEQTLPGGYKSALRLRIWMLLWISPSGKFWSFPLSSLCQSPATSLQCVRSSGETCPVAAKRKQGKLGEVGTGTPDWEAEPLLHGFLGNPIFLLPQARDWNRCRTQVHDSYRKKDAEYRYRA